MNQENIIFKANFSDIAASTLQFSNDKWECKDGKLVLNSDDWWWPTALFDVATDDYQLDAQVELRRMPGKNIGAGFIFRKSGDKAAAFYIWQPLGGYGAQGEILGESNIWSKDCVYALSKDTEVGEHHIRAIVKGNTANFYVDGLLTCILDLTERPTGQVGLYAHHDAIFKSFTISKLSPETKVFTARKDKDPLFGKGIFKSKIKWQDVVKKAGAVLDSAIAEGTEGVPGEESMPAYTYRCVTYMKPGVRPFYAYPAFHHTLIMQALLNYYEYTGNRNYLKEVFRLAEWEMAHSTPADCKLPNLPYSTTMDGKMGGNVDGDSVMLDKAGTMGEMYLKLWKMTGRDSFFQGALKIAETLLRVQLPDGRWQNRVEHATGKVVQDYTSNQIFNIRFMDLMYEATGEDKYAVSSNKALNWLLENPVKTGMWIGYYEDIEAFVKSVGNWDAIETARYLIKNRDKNEKYLKLASEIADWVATSFAVDQDGRWPAICEQSVCMPVMSVHTQHYAQLMLDLYNATGKKYYKDIAISATNAGFELATTSEQWYSLELAPLFIGLDLVKDLEIN